MKVMLKNENTVQIKQVKKDTLKIVYPLFLRVSFYNPTYTIHI